MRGNWVANGIFKWIVRTICLLDGEGVSDAVDLIKLVIGNDDEYGMFSRDYCIAMCEDVMDHFDCKCECLGVSLLLSILSETPRIAECFNLLGAVTRLRSSYYSIILALFGTSSTALFGPSSHKEFRRKIESAATVSINTSSSSSSTSRCSSSSSSYSDDDDDDDDTDDTNTTNNSVNNPINNSINNSIFNNSTLSNSNAFSINSTSASADDSDMNTAGATSQNAEDDDFDSAFEGGDTLTLTKRICDSSHNDSDNESSRSGIGSPGSGIGRVGRIKVRRPTSTSHSAHSNSNSNNDDDDNNNNNEGNGGGETLESFDDAFDGAFDGRASPLQLDFARVDGGRIAPGARMGSGRTGPLQPKAKVVGKVVIPRLAISAISPANNTEEQVLENTAKKVRQSITLTLPEYDVNKSKETAKTALMNTGKKLGQVFPVADLPIMLEYKKHLEKLGLWRDSSSTNPSNSVSNNNNNNNNNDDLNNDSNSGSSNSSNSTNQVTSAGRDTVGASSASLTTSASSLADRSYGRIVVEDNRTHSKQNKTRINFLRAFQHLTQPTVGVAQQNSLIPLLYTDLAMSYSDKSFRFDEEYKRAVWGVLGNLSASVDMTFGMGWAQETEGLREGSREIMGVRRKLDGLLYHLNLRMSNLLKPPVNIVSILAHVHIFADYLERCSNKSIVMEVLYDFLDNLVGLKDFFVKLKGNSPLEYEFSYCVVFVFRKLISQSCSMAVTIYLLKSFFMDHDAWERTKDMATQLFLNAKVIKDISALPNGEKTLTTYRINIMRYFAACANAMKAICAEAAAAARAVNARPYGQRYGYESGSQIEKTFTMMMYKFDFILNPKDGFTLKFLEKADGFDPAISIELLDFLSCLLSTQFAPFHKIDAYVDAYVNHTYVNFLKYYQIKDKTPMQEELCESYLLLLIDCAKSKSKKVCNKLYDLKVLNFMVHEIQLEYDVAYEWARAESGSGGNLSDKFFAQVKHTTPSNVAITTLLNVPQSPKTSPLQRKSPVLSQLQLQQQRQKLTPPLPQSIYANTIAPTTASASASPSPSTSTLSKSGRNLHIPKLALVKNSSGPNLRKIGKIDDQKYRSKSLTGDLRKGSAHTKTASETQQQQQQQQHSGSSIKNETASMADESTDSRAFSSGSSGSSTNSGAYTINPAVTTTEVAPPTLSSSSSSSSSTSLLQQQQQPPLPPPPKSARKKELKQVTKKKSKKVVIPKLVLTKELSDRTFTKKDEEDYDDAKKKDADDEKGKKLGHMSAMQRTFEKANKMQLQLDNHLSGMRHAEAAAAAAASKVGSSSAGMLEKRYMKMREERYVYSNDYIHASVLTYIIANIFNSSETLDDRYFDQFPLQNKKMNIPFIFSRHINHVANKDIVPPLMIEARNVGRSAVVFMKLIYRPLFDPTIFHDLKKIGAGAYGTVYTCNIRVPKFFDDDPVDTATTATTSNYDTSSTGSTGSAGSHSATPTPINIAVAANNGGNVSNFSTAGIGSTTGRNSMHNLTSNSPDSIPDIEVFSETKTLVVKQMPVSKSIHDRCVLHDSFTEILTLDRLKDDHRICRLYDFGVDDENYWIVMKAYKTSLRRWRMQRRGDALNDMLPLYLNVFSNVLDVCMLLLQKRVNHYDIKCDNFFIHPVDDTVSERDFWMPPTSRPTFLPYLGDFGEALLYTTEDEGYTTHNKGTEYIKSPEMLQVAYCTEKNRASYDRLKKAGCNSASDVWSIGCLFYELLTGDYLFFDDDWVCFYMRVTHKDGELLTKENRRMLGDNKYIINFLEAVLIRDQFRRPTLPEVIHLFNTLKPQMLREAGLDPKAVHRIHYSSSSPREEGKGGGGGSVDASASLISPRLASTSSSPQPQQDEDGSGEGTQSQTMAAAAQADASGTTATTTTTTTTSEEVVDLNAVIPQESFDEILHESSIISRLPVEITSHLAMGSVGCFEYPECLIHRFRITHIIDMTGDPNYEHLSSRFTVMKVNPHTIKGYQIIPTIDKCVGFIRSALMRNGRVLLASQSGTTIAAGVAIGCLMIVRIMDIMEAISLVRSMYSPMKLHPMFKSQLFRIAQENARLLGSTPLELTHRFLAPRMHFRCFCGNSVIHLRHPVPETDCETLISCTCDCSDPQGACPNTGAGCGRFIASMNKKYGFDQSALRWALVSESSVCGGLRRIMQSSVVATQFNGVPLAQRKSPKPWVMHCCRLCNFITFSEYIHPMKNGEKLIAVLVNIDAEKYGFNGGLATSLTPYYKELHSSRPIQIIYKNTFLGKKSFSLARYIN